MYIFLLIVGLLALSIFATKLIWKHEITLIEMFMQFTVLILLLLVFWIISFNSKVSDVEILNGEVIKKEVNTIHCSHSYPCNCHTTCSGSGKSRSCFRHCSTCYSHAFDLEYEIMSNIGNYYINTIDSQGLITPPRYTVVKIGDPVSKSHNYTNYIKGSNTSLFASKIALTKEDIKKLPKYPSNIYDYYNIDRIIDLTGDFHKEDLSIYNRILADKLKKIGYTKQANVVMVLTNKNEVFALKLLDYWYGGKKNDIIVIIGIDGNKRIQYTRVHSWSLHSIIDIKIRNNISEMQVLDINLAIDVIIQEINQDYVRRSFKEFEYLKWRILPSTLSLFMFTSLLILISGFIGWKFSRDNLNY